MFMAEAVAQTLNQTTAAPQPDSMLKVVVQFILIFFVLYWFLIRPQKKRLKQHEAELNAIVEGSTVIVAGIEGKVVKIPDAERLHVEIAPHTVITVLRAYVSAVIFETPSKNRKD